MYSMSGIYKPNNFDHEKKIKPLDYGQVEAKRKDKHFHENTYQYGYFQHPLPVATH